jgi:hypothetical protein
LLRGPETFREISKGVISESEAKIGETSGRRREKSNGDKERNGIAKKEGRKARANRKEDGKQAGGNGPSW